MIDGMLFNIRPFGGLELYGINLCITVTQTHAQEELYTLLMFTNFAHLKYSMLCVI
jgi:hypothetical protein